ncbi:MAG: hypothetical protein J0L77_03450 [Alphaproteobacteria bacterium]|nr:hypothetical protein [Alphaproteobacteria bacterium]
MAITDKKSPFSDKGKPSDTLKQTGGIARRGPGVAEKLAGEAQAFKSNLHPYLPQELIGGAVPYIAGTEEEAVWNAASQACGTEKVHYVYSIDEGRCWFLATPSSSFASDPDSWCPLASALPGNSEFWDKETVYLYEQEGIASALRWDPDTARMQVFIGAARTLLPRIQSMDANFVTINPDMAEPVRWKNRALNTELLSRATARMLLLVGIGANLLIFAFLVFQFIFTNTMRRDLETVKRQTDEAASQLTLQAYNALQSDTIRHMVRVQELLDQLMPLGGTLVKYEVNGSELKWEALVPQAYTNSIGGVPVEVVPQPEKDGRARIRGKK